MKRIYTFILLAFIAISISAQESPKQIVAKLGYCTDAIDTGIGTGKSGVNLKAAIMLPTSTMGQHLGSQITRIQVGLKDGGQVSNLKVWIAASKDGQRIVEQSVTTPVDEWNEVFLEIPYDITGNEIWVGYDVTSTAAAAYPLGVCKNAMNENGNWINNGSNWSQLGGGTAGNWNIRAVVDDNQYEEFDVALTSLNIPSGVQAFKPFDIKGVITNNGNQTINSFEVTYVINGGTPIVNMIFDVDVKLGRSYEFTCPTKGVIKTVSNNNVIDVYISYFNQQTDDANPDDNTLTKSNIQSYKEFYPRKTVMDYFTTEKCPNCPPAAASIKIIVGDNPDVIWLSHHAGYYTDKFTIPANTEMCWFYSPGGTYAPAVMLDRVASPSSNTPVESTSYIKTAKLNERIATPAFVSVDITGSYIPNERRIDIDVVGNLAIDFDAKTNLTVYLVENGIHSATQSNGGTDYVHNHVVRHLLTPTFGEYIGVETAGSKFSKKYSYTIPQDWNTDNVEVVAIVNRYNSASRIDCPIYNGNANTLSELAAGRYKINVDGQCNISDVNFILSGEGVYAPNSEVTITADAEIEGYKVEFLGWYLDGVEMSKDPNYMFLSGEINLNYVAKFNAKPLSVSDVKNIDVKVYPNPANNVINVEGDYNTLEIISTSGKIVKHIDVKQSSINIEDLSNGIYIIRVSNYNATKTIKIVKQN